MEGFSCPGDEEMNEYIIFGYQVACLLEEVSALRKGTIAQFHEYQTGVGLIVAHRRSLPVATVFTTHATILGRHICAGKLDFYNMVSSIDADAEAQKRGVFHRFWVERESSGSFLEPSETDY